MIEKLDFDEPTTRAMTADECTEAFRREHPSIFQRLIKWIRR